MANVGTEFKVLDVSANADNALALGQIVKITSTGVDVATAATDAIYGVAQDVSNDANTIANIRVEGVARVQASAAIAVGDLVTATTGGQAVTTTTAGDHVLGMATLAATAQGDIITVLIGKFNY